MQLKRLHMFIEPRKQIWETLRLCLAAHEDVLEFALLTHATGWDPETGFSWDTTGCRTDCSWFGFKIAVKAGARFIRTELAQELDRYQVGNRMLFGVNLLPQQTFVQLRQDRPDALRAVTEMTGSDEIMSNPTILGYLSGADGGDARIKTISYKITYGIRVVLLWTLWRILNESV
jgi:CDP-6-deoxy-D-xylo-4-hexulose-3-dehydrase